jgi:hypothetical protein
MHTAFTCSGKGNDKESLSYFVVSTSTVMMTIGAFIFEANKSLGSITIINEIQIIILKKQFIQRGDPSK